MLVDVVPVDPMPQTRPLRQGHHPIAVERVRGIFQVRRYGVIVDARGEKAALVVLADILAACAKHLDDCQTAHKQITHSYEPPAYHLPLPHAAHSTSNRLS